MITCDEALRLLDDYVDGALGEGRSAEVAAHLAGCAACRGEESAARGVLAAAAELPAEIEPARDLWPGIAARLDAPVVPFPREKGPSRLRRWAPLAAAAAILVVATAIVTTRVTGRAPLVSAAVPTPTAPAGLVLAGSAGDPGLATAVAEYRRAAAALEHALAQRRASMSPATLRVLDANLAIVDAAIAELTRAVAAQPSNRDLAQLLSAAYQQQIDLLETANQLSRT